MPLVTGHPTPYEQQQIVLPVTADYRLCQENITEKITHTISTQYDGKR